MHKFIPLDVTGTLWKQLSLQDQNSITKQLPKILSDPQIYLYRFVRTGFHIWTIPNAMTLPLRTQSMVLA